MDPNKPLVRRDVFGLWWRNGQSIGRRVPPTLGDYHNWVYWMGWIDGHIQFETINDQQELIKMKTITIELRVDPEEDGELEVLKDAAMQAAKHLFTSALLISKKRKPQIAMYTNDMFAGTEEIKLADDLIDLQS